MMLELSGYRLEKLMPSNEVTNNNILMSPAVLPDGNGGFTSCPELMTESEVIQFLRIPKVSKARNYGNVIENLKKMYGLPCIHIYRQPLYPTQAVRKWIEEKHSSKNNCCAPYRIQV